MNPTAIYSKSGKGVQEASGKTSLLKRPDRAVLAAIDGRANLGEVAQKVGKAFDAEFQKLITQLDKDGFIREVSAGAPAAAPAGAPKPAAAKPAAKPAGGDLGADLDFSSLGGSSKPAPAPSRPASPPPPPKPAAAPSRPATPPTPPPPGSPFAQLDFSSLGTQSKPAVEPSRPAAPPPPPAAAKEQQSALAKAREEAEARAQADRDKLKAEVEAKARAELEAKLREEAEKKLKYEAATQAEVAPKAAEAEAKVKAAREAALKAAEAKVKVEAEAKAKLEAERKAREETERRLEAERKAREEAERRAKEEAERARKEAEEKARREAEELRQRLEEERKAREEAERKAKEEAERVRRELEEERKRLEAERKREEEERAARKKREEEEAEARRKQREEEDRKAEEERAAKRKKREEEEAAREAEEQAKREAKRKKREEEEAAREAEEQTQREAKRRREEEQAAALLAAAQARDAQKAAAAPAPKAEPKKADSFGDSLLADLDSFSNRDEDERKAKEEEERKAKAEAERRNREEAERQAKEEAEREQRAQEERRRQEEQARRAREEEERREQEEERRRREADEIRRKAAAATAAAMAKEGKSAPKSEDDIPISDDDLQMDEVTREQAALARSQAKEKEKDQERERAAAKAEKRVEAESARYRKPVKWGKLISTTLIVLVVGGLVAVHLMPVPVADYERSATEALGRPVKIGGAKYWLLTGPQVRFENVRIGEARISQVSASMSPGSFFGDRKEFSRVEIDSLTLPQEALAEALFATVKADNLVVDRIVIKSLELAGPAVMPKGLQADAQLDSKGALRNATLRGPDGLVAKIVPKEGALDFDVVAAGFTLPIAPEITLSKFGMKGSANPRGMKIDEWGGAIFNGGISGTASVRWGGTWTVEGVVTVRSINAAVFAPALLSNGTAEGTGRFSMTGADPAKLGSAGRLEGNFTVTQGTLGSYDLAKGIQTGGKQAAGTTAFTEMTGQALYDKGAVSLRNVSIGAGALNAAMSADIAQSGALSGRIVADAKTAGRSQQATIVLGGTVKEPQVRN